MGKDAVAAVESLRKPRTASRFAKLMLPFASLVFTLLMIEVVMRIAGVAPQTATVLSTFFEFDEHSGWRGKPDARSRFTTMNFDVFVSHDHNGFRRSGYDRPIETDTTSKDRIVWVLGDSGTWGWGIEDGKTYVDLLNRMSEDGTRYRNLGHCGFSSVQQYLLLKDLFEEGKKPKEVVVLECNNDLIENLDARDQSPGRAYLEVSGESAEIKNWPTPRQGWGLMVWLKNNSLVWNHAHFYCRRAVLMRGERKREALLAEQIKAPPKSTAAVSAKPTDAKQAETKPADAYPFAPFSPEQMVGLRHSYRMMRDLCAKHDVKLRIVNEGGPYVPAVCDDLGITWLSLADRWHRHAASPQAAEPTAFKTDPHFNELGHRMIAEAIYSELQRVRGTEATAAAQTEGRKQETASTAAHATTTAR